MILLQTQQTINKQESIEQANTCTNKSARTPTTTTTKTTQKTTCEWQLHNAYLKYKIHILYTYVHVCFFIFSVFFASPPFYFFLLLFLLFFH